MKSWKNVVINEISLLNLALLRALYQVSYIVSAIIITISLSLLSVTIVIIIVIINVSLNIQHDTIRKTVGVAHYTLPPPSHSEIFPLI